MTCSGFILQLYQFGFVKNHLWTGYMKYENGSIVSVGVRNKDIDDLCTTGYSKYHRKEKKKK